MKRQFQRLFALVLLFAASVATYAETGTMERFGAKMKYTFSGGMVTAKSDPIISNVLNDYMTVLIDGEIRRGDIFKAGFQRLAGPTKFPKVTVGYTIYDENGKKIADNSDEGKGSASISLKVPENAKEICVSMFYNAIRTKFACELKWKVVDFYSKEDAGEPLNYSAQGKLKHPDRPGTMNFFVGGGILRKDDKSSQYRSVDMRVAPGTTIEGTFIGNPQNFSGNGKPEVVMTFTVYGKGKDGNHTLLVCDKIRDSKEVKKTYTIPKGTTSVKMAVSYIGTHCDVEWEVLDEAEGLYPSQQNKLFNWDDIAPDNFCPRCKKPASSLTLSDGAYIGCSTEATKHFRVATINRPIYAGDGIIARSDVDVRLGSEKVFTIKAGSKVLFVGMVNGKPRFRVVKGKIEGGNMHKVR